MFRKLHEVNPARVTVEIDGVSTEAEVGETIASVLLRQTDAWSRLNPVTGSRRAPYCMMGVCFECLAEVDGVASIQTCLTPVSEGMRIVRQSRRRSIAS